MLVLEPSFAPGFLRIVDAYALKSIISIHNSKIDVNKVLILLKLGMSEVGCEVVTEERERLVTSIIDKKLKAPNY